MGHFLPMQIKFVLEIYTVVHNACKMKQIKSLNFNQTESSITRSRQSSGHRMPSMLDCEYTIIKMFLEKKALEQMLRKCYDVANMIPACLS